MEQNEIIGRYIYAATRRLPGKLRDDVKLELQSIISDMLEQRCGDLTPTEHDVRLVLTEMGPPWELEAKYQPDCTLGVLSGAYYNMWKLVLKIVLLCVGFGITVACGISFFSEQPVWYKALGSWLATLLSSSMSAFGFVTLLFMIFQQKKIPMQEGKDFLDELPPVPNQKLTIPMHETIIDLVLNGAFALIFLAFPQILVGIFQGGQTIPVFSLSVLQGCWPWILGIAALGILVSSMELIEGRYTRRLVAVTTVAQLLTVLLAAFWLFTPNLLNPEMLQRLPQIFDNEAVLVQMIAHIPQLLFGVIAFASLLEIAMKLWKLRYIPRS